MTWKDGGEERAESRRRISERLSQTGLDLIRTWKIYRRSLLAITGLLLVIFVITISALAPWIAVEHPGRDIQDTKDVWSIDYEPQRKSPGSEECDMREQKVSLTELRRWDENGTLALSPTRIAEDSSFYQETLVVTDYRALVDRQGYPLPLDLLYLEPSNNSYFWISDELMENNSINQITITYMFDNEEMHHWWMPDWHDVCIFGTNEEGQDMFSKILYGSRVSLQIGFTVATLTVIIGTIIGSISGYFGGRVDEVIMRITDIFFAVPGLILALAFVAALQAVDDFTLPLWFALLIPIGFLAVLVRSHIDQTLFPKSIASNSSSDSSYVFARAILIFGICFVFMTLGPWEYVFEIGESRAWRLAATIFALCFVGFILSLDRHLIDMIPVEGIGIRAKDAFDWRNPYRYLTFRTFVIFIAAAIIFLWSGNDEGSITVIENFDRLWKIQIALVFTGWPGYARLIRGQVLYVKEMTFVEAARSVGAPSGRIMFRHILPNAWAPLLVAFTLDIGGTILSASGLSFIGLGAEPGAAEWGKLVSDGRAFFPQDYWLVFFPGMAILVTTLGFNLLGDGLRDVVDPKNRR
tara:strand:+ start:885 stop:2630 length:1746 start_codon:yes stop_codon:yes gene_type:complete